MAAQVTLELTAHRRWWLRLMLPTLVAIAWLMPRRMKDQVDVDSLAEWIVENGVVVKLNGKAIHPSRHK